MRRRDRSIAAGVAGWTLLQLLAGCGDGSPASERAALEPVQTLGVRIDGGSPMPPQSAGIDAFGEWLESNAPADAVVHRVLAGDASSPIAVALELPMETYVPEIVGKGNATPHGILPIDLLATYSVVIGSGFVQHFSPAAPLGLLQVDGVLISEVQRHGYTRILGTRGDDIGVVEREAFHPGLFESAMQVGPGIIERGGLDITERELRLPRYLRAFVGRCDGRAFVGATTEPVHLRTLGELLIAHFESHALDCDEVVNLSGDREVVFGVRNAAGDRAFYGVADAAKASVVAFKMRRSVPGQGAALESPVGAEKGP